MTLNLAETSGVKSRPSVPYKANLSSPAFSVAPLATTDTYPAYAAAAAVWRRAVASDQGDSIVVENGQP